MGLDIRGWLALQAGCGSDDLRFAGTDARGVNSVILYFTLDGGPGYRVQITPTSPAMSTGRGQHGHGPAAPNGPRLCVRGDGCLGELLEIVHRVAQIARDGTTQELLRDTREETSR
jgi:hypothetical protein